MLIAILFKPFLALLLLSLITSLFGPIVLWQKLTYFGDAMAHSLILGFVLANFLPNYQHLVLLLFVMFFIITINFLIYKNFFQRSVIIIIVAYFCISLAFLINDISINKFNFNTLLMGDVLASNTQDLLILFTISLFSLGYLYYFFNDILLIIINEDLAKTQQISVEKVKFCTTIILGFLIAIALKIVGVFLVSSLLILPASIAKIFAKSPQQMLCFSMLFSLSLTIIGIIFASYYNLSLAPALVLVMIGCFFCCNFFVKKS
jgi:zinc transport system permease protein